MKKRYQGVTAYTGLPGSGKTYSLAAVGTRALARGRRVFANDIPLEGRPWLDGAEGFGSFDEFLELVASVDVRDGGAVVCWDELPLFVNARKWQEFPDGLLYTLTQVRKDGLEMHFSTIDWRMVDINVRRITFWVWECRALGFGLHRKSLYPPEERRKKDEGPRSSEFFRIRQDVRDRYDTFGKVAAFGSVSAPAARAAIGNDDQADDASDVGAAAAAVSLASRSVVRSITQRPIRAR
jgi:hypothetical protein